MVGQIFPRCRGQVALPFVLIIAGIIVEIAIAGSFIVFYMNNSQLGERLSVRALAAAHAGVRDATIEITRNKEFVTLSTSTYSFKVGEDSVQVEVSRTTDGVSEAYLYTVTATGMARTRQKKLQAQLAVHQVSGEVHLLSLEEVAS